MTSYPLASSTWDERELEAIQSVIDSGQFTMGRHVEEYERAFADYFGSKYAVMVNSGSSANLLMVAALFFLKNPLLKAGDEVIVPAVSWSTSYFPLQQYGLKLRFVDIDPQTLNVDTKKLESAITPQTRAILLVNLLGNPNEFSEIERIIAGRDITLLEDNCESMGAMFEGRCAGTFGLMGTFSSFFSHHIATMEGGCVVTDDEEVYHVLLCLRAHGWTRNLPKHNRVTGTKGDSPFEESFKFVLPGYNLRPLEMSGAIGKEQLKKLPSFIKVRRENALHFQDLFGEDKNLRVQQEIGQSSWFGFSLIVKEGAPFTRQTLISNFQCRGVECRPIVTGNFLKNSDVLRFFTYEISGAVECAEYIDAHGLFVGNHHTDTRKEIDLLRAIVNDLR